MKPICAALVLTLLLPTLWATPANAADAGGLFADKPYRWRTDAYDKRFLKSRLYAALETPPEDPACARVVASFLMAFAEAAPYFHKKDETFPLFQTLIAPLQSEHYPAADYLRQMVRRTMLDKKAPDAWLKTARALKAKYKAPIDLDRLAYAVDGPLLIDNLQFSLGAFVERYNQEVALAPSLAQPSALDRFRDMYLDRDIAWGGLMLMDVQKLAPRAKPDSEPAANEPPIYLATLVLPIKPAARAHPLQRVQQPAPIVIKARLQDRQYLDLTRTVRSRSYVVRARLWEFTPGDGSPGSPPLTFDLRDGLLFEDRDWSAYTGFATNRDAEACSEICINDLSLDGLQIKQGIGQNDGFGH